ncbi:RNA-dependent RNA polymerase [Planoprotostelium fungivorum]|uniref:RNA-dependent RNA polymerase n=1 Tax=Planoprotostelium fungivorum TaxID=1890364 RepID=A0A2P6MNU6_9EUKA|nr:RNA-dependent RNA polymerase [Planoprotostelium fungivorum]
MDESFLAVKLIGQPRSVAWGRVIDTMSSSPFDRSQCKCFRCCEEDMSRFKQDQSTQTYTAYQPNSDSHHDSDMMDITNGMFRLNSDIDVNLPISRKSCRLFRFFPKEVDRFIIVEFPASDYEPLVQEHMYHGIEDEKRRYTFLGFSDNDLKERRQIYFREDASVRVKDVLSLHGELDQVWLKDPYKWYARFGMSMTETTQTIHIPIEACAILDDIATADGRHYFSDGCGLITMEAARQVSAILSLPSIPSVFQFRYGGAKGVLMVQSDAVIMSILERQHLNYDPTVKIYLRRNTNVKFKSRNTRLEIVQWSSRSKDATINMGIILLLSSLGVPDKSFEKLLDMEMESIFSMTESHAAISRRLPPSGSVHQEGKLYNSLYELNLAQTPFGEPIFRSLIERFKKIELARLREKMRLTVPVGATPLRFSSPQDSKILFGVVDDTKTLKPGEVYVNFGDTSPLEGQVVIYRHPCYHPGDIQKHTAVSYPELQHIKGPCLVFPAVGERPAANTMGGGDLDGDTFFVTQNPLVMFPESNYPPFDYSNPTPKSLDFLETSKNFFCDFQKRDKTGMIANLWTQAAQMVGPKHNDALQLAKLFSSAIDSAKTGKFVYIPNDLFKYNSRGEGKIVKTLQKGNAVLVNLMKKLDAKTSKETNPNNKGEKKVPYDGFSYKRDTLEWKSEYEQADRYLKMFNGQLRDKLNEEEKLGFKPKNNKKMQPLSISEEFRVNFRKNHLDGYRGPKRSHQDHHREDHHEHLLEPSEWRCVRASAWYFHCVEQQKTALAELCIPYLNNILCNKTWGDRPAPCVARRPPN